MLGGREKLSSLGRECSKDENSGDMNNDYFLERRQSVFGDLVFEF
mgnify:CR=1 FL=1